MAFDFNQQPLRIYGIWPQTPFPLEVSIYGYCRMSCSFCFANRNRDAADRELHLKNSTAALFRQIERATQDQADPIGFFLREKYPICFSNTTDPFQRDEKQYRATEAFLGWAKANGTPLYVQTRGNVLLEEWERYSPLLVPGKDVVYVSVCQLDDAVRRKQEPGAQSIDKRFELIRRLSDHGVPVVAACNPYVKEWVPDPDAYCLRAAEAGARGVWLESLHFTAAQADTLAAPYRDLLFKSNLQPMFVVHELKKWRAATAAHGLDFFPNPHWDSYYRHQARHPECADPAWLGGKTLDFNFRLLKLIRDASGPDGKVILVGWPEIRRCLDLWGVPNPTLKASAFWYPFNNRVKADHDCFKAALGKAAPFYEVVRYFFNHPWENQGFLWYDRRAQIEYDEGRDVFVGDKRQAGDLVLIYNPRANLHHRDERVTSAWVDAQDYYWLDADSPSLRTKR